MSATASHKGKFVTARELNEISGSDIADVSCKLIVTV